MVVPGTHVVSPGMEAVSSFPPDGVLLCSEAGGDGVPSQLGGVGVGAAGSPPEIEVVSALVTVGVDTGSVPPRPKRLNFKKAVGKAPPLPKRVVSNVIKYPSP